MSILSTTSIFSSGKKKKQSTGSGIDLNVKETSVVTWKSAESFRSGIPSLVRRATNGWNFASVGVLYTWQIPCPLPRGGSRIAVTQCCTGTYRNSEERNRSSDNKMWSIRLYSITFCNSTPNQPIGFVAAFFRTLDIYRVTTFLDGCRQAGRRRRRRAIFGSYQRGKCTQYSFPPLSDSSGRSFGKRHKVVIWILRRLSQQPTPSRSNCAYSTSGQLGHLYYCLLVCLSVTIVFETATHPK